MKRRERANLTHLCSSEDMATCLTSELGSLAVCFMMGRSRLVRRTWAILLIRRCYEDGMTDVCVDQ
jgi:hypothetical protein